MGIRFILMVHKQGQTRLAQYYEYLTLEERRALEGEIVRKYLARTEQQEAVLLDGISVRHNITLHDYVDRWSLGFGPQIDSLDKLIGDCYGVENGIGVVKLMGRNSGELPFLIGAGGLFEYIEKRLKENGQMVIVIAEGAGQEPISKSIQSLDNGKDASGNKLFQDVGLWISQEIKRITEKQNNVVITDRMWARLLSSANQPSFWSPKDVIEDKREEEPPTELLDDRSCCAENDLVGIGKGTG